MDLKRRARALIDDTDSLPGRIFNYTIYLLIVLSLITFSVETLRDLDPSIRGALSYFDWVVIVVFTAEYVLRLWTAERRLRFVFSFFGLIDLVAILPFYLALGVDLRSARSLRLLRLFLILKIFRYSQAARRLTQSFLMVREEIILFTCLTLILLWLSAMGIYYFEQEAQPDKFESVFHALWWSVATITTVGYGDIYPVTIGGRVFTFLVLLIGMGLVAVPAGLLAASLTRVVQREQFAAGESVQSAGAEHSQR